MNILQYHKEDWHFNRQIGKLQLCFFFLKVRNNFFLLFLFYRVRKKTVEITNVFIEFLSSATPLRVDFLQQPPFQGGPETFPGYLSNPSPFNSDDLKKVFFKYKSVYKFFYFFCPLLFQNKFV